jgi:site-specific DNA-methyltransferase (adenine-specific)
MELKKKYLKGGGSHTKSACKFSQLYKENSKKWDIKPPKEYFKQLIRVSENQIICGGNYFSDMFHPSRGWAIFDKVTDGVTCVNPELIYTSFHLSCKIFRRPQGLNNGFLNKEGKNIHPTQKPYQLYEWLLNNYAKPNDTILDTHLGSGSSAIACLNRGFKMTAFEIDEEYFDAACRRIEKAYKTRPRLFDTVEKKVIKQINLF